MKTKQLIVCGLMAWMAMLATAVCAQNTSTENSSNATQAAVEIVDSDDMEDADEEENAATGLHQVLKTKFIEGNAGFMSLVALALVLGLAFCIERII